MPIIGGFILQGRYIPRIKTKPKELLFAFLCVFCLFCRRLGFFAAAGPTLRTTLSDNTTQRGSKKTFDVWARNASGEKSKTRRLRLTAKTLSPTWDDNENQAIPLTLPLRAITRLSFRHRLTAGEKSSLHITLTTRKRGRAKKSARLFGASKCLP